ncbi:type II secretion system protein GspM [Acidovorax sp. MR-S7]|uniref:type II secretion system protein GspM n=1 Tax=Acidovorax sp. MR-S7 TaxID=1268622 RepID=UPI0003D3F6B7|nr:type II secretion system protein GspM [Acidovorax sp. MR-S7]GAD20292.1 hypothetical protein AVS7_00053 [Acidovorax sp. MR-S7]
MNTWTRRAVAAALLCALAVLVCMALAYHVLWNRYDSALELLESRSERLDGVVSAGSDIQALLDNVHKSVSPLIHPGGESAQNEIQQQLRELISSSGSTLVSSQVAVEPGGDGKLARVRLTATVTGEWTKLLRFMGTLQTHTPAFWVRAASILREGSNTGASGQNGRITLQLEAPVASVTSENKKP